MSKLKLKKLFIGAASMVFAAALALSAAACTDNNGNNGNTGNTGNTGDNEENSIYSFHDEFHGKAVDDSKWDYQEGDGTEYNNPGWGNNEEQYYRRENARVENDCLIITAQIEDEQTQEELGKKYTSSKLVTKDIFSQTYGRFEARIRVTEAIEGIWPAFWLMPEDGVYGGWPRSGEIDIMELKGRLPGQASSAAHYKDGGANRYHSANYYFQEGTDITDFHVYALDWTPEYLAFSVDGVVYHTFEAEDWTTTPSTDVPPTETSPYDQNFFILLNFAIFATYGLIFKRLDAVMYTIIAQFVVSRAIDTVLYGLSTSKVCYLISEHKSEELEQAITSTMHRGVTMLDGKGGYTGQQRSVLMCVIKKRQITELRKIVTAIDPNAFFIVTDAKDVFGNGFGNINDD